MPTSKLPGRLLLFALLLTLAIGSLFGSVIFNSRIDSLQRAKETNHNVLTSTERALDRSIFFADMALRDMVALLAEPMLDSLTPRIRQLILFSGAASTEGFGPTMVLDERGYITSSNTGTWWAENFADLEDFKHHQDTSTNLLYVSTPMVSRLTGDLSISLSRRLNHQDGRFAGIVSTTLKVSYIRELLSAVSLGPDSGLNLFRDDGIVINRFTVDGAGAGTSVAGTPIFERFRQGEDGFMAHSGADGKERLYSFRRLSGYPLLLGVALSSEQIYSDWARRAIPLGAITLSLMAGCLALTWLFAREIRRGQLGAQRLRRAQRDIGAVLDSVPSMIAYWDTQLRNRFANRAYLECFGFKPADIEGRAMRDVIGEKLVDSNLPYAARALEGHRQSFDRTLTDVHGKERHLITTYIPDIEDGEVQGFFVQLSDITKRKRAEDALLAEKEKLRVTLNSIGDAVIATDTAAIVDYLNPIAEMITGWTLDEARGRSIDEVLDIRNLADSARVENPLHVALRDKRIVGLTTNSVLVNRDGVSYHIEDSAAPIMAVDGELIGAVMVFHDVSATREMSLKMAHLAQYDALTDLPNRVLLLDRSLQALARAARDGTRVAVLYIDLDRFKNINDSLGHDVGDKLLVEFAQRMAGHLNAADTLSRQGGDEFVLLACGVCELTEIGDLAQRIIQLCAEPFSIGGHSLSLSVSIGVSVFPDDGLSFGELAKNADTAMYIAKQAGRNRYHFFAKEYGRQADRRLWLEHALKHALAHREFFLEYQPKIDSQTRAVVGLEALVRWRKDGKVVPPGEFISLAEETGLIIPLGKYIIEATIRDLALLRASSFPVVPVAVNISAGQFTDPSFSRYVATTLAEGGLTSAAIELEITESLLMQNLAPTIAALKQMRETGVRIAIDDFGTGYSSMSYLRDLPVDTLKIDKSFVDDIAKGERDRGIVHAIIILGHHLGLTVTAEGVELEEQANILRALGCDQMQGYLFCKPLGVEQLLAWHARSEIGVR
jgi:diguanylate cyclase (GGDEF)-like protein/PAS domain S-box-containing protein